ncbi:GTP 3',8-cyclase MoaA [Oerskovia turbata]|uniref:GTP 3',8-cyclase MoaA n=1 Tax=Oerskovia turbata TaxID=1713 RepID=UPI000AF616CB|nr:GTP 3',8-cyclase MoaA [Oerskovia turbata]
MSIAPTVERTVGDLLPDGAPPAEHVAPGRADPGRATPSGALPPRRATPSDADRRDAPGLVDRFGRRHRDLRISLTDRCSLRCTYCMPAEGMPWLASDELLTVTEMTRVAAVAVRHGIQEIRLTGGEPLLRPDIVEIVTGLAALPGAPEVSMTTNGLRLPALAAPLRDAGLSRLNTSLDTLRRDRYAQLTRRDRLDQALAGLAAADRAGFTRTKLNAVLVRGVNDDETVDLLRFALERGYELRFIEQMPLDAGRTWTREGMVTADEVLASLSRSFDLAPVPTRGAAPAERWTVDGTDAVVGIVASVTRPFCGACDRIRLTSDGQLRSCLFAHDETDLRTLLRAGADDEQIAAALGLAVRTKAAGHTIGSADFEQPARGMSAIGG